MASGRLRRFLRSSAVWLAISAVTLLAIDLLCVAFGLFPPTYDLGHPTLGWAPNMPGEVVRDLCTEYSTGEQVEYWRNEVGVRTDRPAAELAADDTTLKIAVVGDSQTDLCAPNDRTHPGVLETGLRARGIDATVLSSGVGRYSPLQAYLLFRENLQPLGAEVLVLNLYTGNDFNDILRVDDRPYLVPEGDGYRIQEPVWYRYEAPGTPRWSRVRFLFSTLADGTGLPNLYFRVRFLADMAAERGRGLGTVFSYLLDLRRSIAPSIGYQEALAAQMLNQQLFFHHFPGAREESVRRVGALMERIRQDHPGMLLVMSPLPSYELAGETPVDEALLTTLERLPVSRESGMQQERQLYGTLRELSEETGWVFIDNLPAIQAYDGDERLFNDFDYHLTPPASAIIGANEADVLARHLATTATVRR